MMSKTVIEQPLRLAVIDASGNAAGWESQVCQRLVATLVRRGLAMVSDTPLAIDDPSDLGRHANELAEASCIVLCGPGEREGLAAYWRWLSENVGGPKLVVVCSWEAYDPALSEAVLRDEPTWAPIAVVPQSPVAARDGALFLLKFLVELDLHSQHTMTGRMAWFAWTKARELLRRRGLAARFELRT
jgi:hypothetical protein